MTKQANILFLADTGHHTQAVQDHIQAISHNSQFYWHIVNPIKDKMLHELDFSHFDAIGIHYSIKAYNPYYLSKKLKKKLREYAKIKFIFLQDEHCHGNDNQAVMVDIDCHILFTLVQPNYLARAYPHPAMEKIKKVTILTAYAPENLHHYHHQHQPISKRPIDIFYRVRAYPFWLGRLAHEKIEIAEGILQRASSQSDLKIDISTQEKDRIYGQAWIKRISDSKAVLGTESGASIWDADGQIETLTKKALAANPNADFESIHQQVLAPFEGNIIYNAISPRIFEAAALRTPMILFPGEYNGLIQPDRHYILLEKKFTNYTEVIRKIKDFDYLEQIADEAYGTLIASGNYASARLGDIVANTLKKYLSKMTASSSNQASIIASSQNSQDKNEKEEMDKNININLEVNKNIAINKNIESNNYIDNYIETMRKRHKLKNIFACATTEAKFIVKSFFHLLRDPRYQGIKKFKLLHNGFRRYLSYFKARYKQSL